MKIQISEFGNVGTKITLIGKLDIVGAEKVDLPLATAAGARGNIVVDMSGVGFIASTGIRHLVMATRTVAGGPGTLA
jgi:anti-anti-sigma factor